MTEEIQGSEDIKRQIRAKAIAHFEGMLVERPALRESWEELRKLNPSEFEQKREVWIHGFAECFVRIALGL